MRYLLFLGVLTVPGGLFYAYLAETRTWSRGLYVSAGGVSLLAALFVIFGMQRATDKKDWQGPSAGVLGLGAVAARLAAIKWYHAPERGPKLVNITEIGLVSLYWVTGLAALFLGAYGVLMATTAPRGHLSKKRARYDLLAGSTGLASALYCFASVSQRLGVGINHWTFLGLVGLAGIAFLLALGAQKLTGGNPLKKPKPLERRRDPKLALTHSRLLLVSFLSPPVESFPVESVHHELFRQWSTCGSAHLTTPLR